MLLITMHEWLGPSKLMTFAEARQVITVERQTAFATKMQLSKAIEEIYKYQEQFNKDFFLDVAYRLLQVTEIYDLTDKQLLMCDVRKVENLSKTTTKFQSR